MLTKADLNQNIRLYKLNQITDNDDTVIDAAIREAIGILINTMTGPGYDTTIIFGQSGDNRDAQVLGWAKYIAVYKLFERIPDTMVPERVIKNYDDTMAELRRVSDGRLSLNLPRVTAADGTPTTKFRWGSQKLRRG